MVTADRKQLLHRIAELRLDDPAQGRPRKGHQVSGQPAIELAQAEGEVPHAHVPCSSVEHVDHLLPGEVTPGHQGLEQCLVQARLHRGACPSSAWQP